MTKGSTAGAGTGPPPYRLEGTHPFARNSSSSRRPGGLGRRVPPLCLHTHCQGTQGVGAAMASNPKMPEADSAASATPRNSRTRGGWGRGQRKTSSKQPGKRGQPTQPTTRINTDVHGARLLHHHHTPHHPFVLAGQGGVKWQDRSGRRGRPGRRHWLSARCDWKLLATNDDRAFGNRCDHV